MHLTLIGLPSGKQYGFRFSRSIADVLITAVRNYQDKNCEARVIALHISIECLKFIILMLNWRDVSVNSMLTVSIVSLNACETLFRFLAFH